MTWVDTDHAFGDRHTYGRENGETTRICFGDNVRFGGGGSGLSDISDPTGTWTSVSDPTGTWSDVTDPS